jgi:hypothetical protein
MVTSSIDRGLLASRITAAFMACFPPGWIACVQAVFGEVSRKAAALASMTQR